MATDVLERKLSLPDLARAWGWHPDKLRRLVEKGAIPHSRICGRIYFELATVETWLACCRRAERRRQDSETAPHADRSRLQERRALGLPDEETFGM